MRRPLQLAAGMAVVLGACTDPVDPMPGEPAVRVEEHLSEARSDAAYGPAGMATYHVAITNLTESGQPLTPPLAATHRPAISMFDVGQPASLGLKEIAENGNLAPMQSALTDSRHVADIIVAATPPVPPLEPGETVEFDITTERGAMFFSFVSMLICTNDGFTGVSGVRLPKRIGDEVTMQAGAYDAGTEMNTEDFADLVPPCPVLSGVASTDPGTGMSNPALAENGVVHMHMGIQGVADLDAAIHGWTNPVVEIVIERTG